jgi:hypothetical protein
VVEEKNKMKEQTKIHMARGHYMCEKVVGSGVFGTVYKVRVFLNVRFIV